MSRYGERSDAGLLLMERFSPLSIALCPARVRKSSVGAGFDLAEFSSEWCCRYGSSLASQRSGVGFQIRQKHLRFLQQFRGERGVASANVEPFRRVGVQIV